MKTLRTVLFMLGIAVLLAACGTKGGPAEPSGEQEQSSAPGSFDRETALDGFQKGSCGACHVIPGVPNAVGTIGPDLTEINLTALEIIQSDAYTGKAKTAADFVQIGRAHV